MLKFIKNFRKDEDGAVTVDWVVLTAAVLALGGAAATAISGGAANMTGAIGDELDGGVPTTGFGGGTGGTGGTE